jgi:hypothetical protein
LSYLSGLRSDEDADTMTVKRITASLSEVASRALPDASAPSYGWWSLAANFLSAGMDEASRICAERAIRAGESLDESLEDEVLVRVIDHVIGADVSDEQLIWWLEQGEARL